MFFHSDNFNGAIGNWDTSKVTNMKSMFGYAISFNQDIGNWITSNVDNMEYMFDNAISFNQDLSNWNVDNVTSAWGFCFSTESWTLPKPNFNSFNGNLGCN